MTSRKLSLWLALAVGAGQSFSVRSSEPASLDADQVAILRAGDARRLQEALDRGLPVNGRDTADNTPLMLEAVYGSPACVRMLLERGANANATNRAGATPLMRAAWDKQKIRILLEHGANA